MLAQKIKVRISGFGSGHLIAKPLGPNWKTINAIKQRDYHKRHQDYAKKGSK